MNDSELRFEAIAHNLLASKVASDPAEIHGILCGMLAGGMSMDNREWLMSMADFINAGESFSVDIEKLLIALFEDTCKQLQNPDFTFELCIPEDGAPISERGHAVVSWVQGFLLGFGVQQEQRKSCSDEVKEALQDFSEISKMDAEMAETEEAEQALFEVTEYIRISVMLCFGELGQASGGDLSAFRTLH
ncbi:MAG: UPF0149 family protein [Aestuariibacter sp.]